MQIDHLLYEFLSVTENAAIAAIDWIGRGEKNKADQAATEAMRSRLNQLNIDATVVIGEGELDEAPMLFIGERLGTRNGPRLDIAVDPLDGTSLIATGQGNSISVIAAAIHGSLLHAPDMYMEKLAVGKNAAGKVDITFPLIDNMKIVAESNNKSLKDLNIMVQDRERHVETIQEIQKAGARVTLFNEVDVISAIAPAIDQTGIDMFVGIGGAPEGVLSAVALKSLGGDFQAKLCPVSDSEYERCVRMGLKNPETPLYMRDIVRSNQCCFIATGITDGLLLKGVKIGNRGQLKLNSFTTYADIGKGYFIESILPALALT